MGRWGEISGEACILGEGCRSQSPRSTANGRQPIEFRAGCHGKARQAEPSFREGGQEGGSGRFMSKQSESEASTVPKEAKQDAQAQGRDGSWAQACVWNERMLAALDNGKPVMTRWITCNTGVSSCG